MNQREVIYADIHVQSAECCKFETLLDDDLVEYAKVNNLTSKVMDTHPKQNEPTSENSNSHQY